MKRRMSMKLQQTIQTFHSDLVYDRYGNLKDMLKLLGSKQGRQIIRSETQLKQFYQWLDSIKDGTMIVAEYKVFRAYRSQNQVNAHFGLVIEMIRKQMKELGWDICGVLPNKEMIHEILKKCCGGVGENGETMGLSEMD